MKLVKTLKPKGMALEKKQLEEHLEMLASDHVIQNKSSKKTYPVWDLEENFRFITKTYDLLSSHLKLGIQIHPAGEWLLDNYYILEEEVKGIIKDLPLKKYINFLGIQNSEMKGYARIYVLASEIVGYTNGSIRAEDISDYIKAYQNKKTLNMEEIWNISVFLKISLIRNIANVCEKIYSSQMQKYKVENIIERLVENKGKSNQKFNKPKQYFRKVNYNAQMKYPFIEYMSYRLKRYGKKTNPFSKVLEEQINKMGLSVSDVIKKEHFDIAVKKVQIGNSIKSIKDMQRINFQEIFEKINGVEEILKKDPCYVYENMDFKTKEHYRNEIKELSKKTKISEIYIAKKALKLAEKEFNNNADIETNKKAHIGYYLISEGKQILLRELQSNFKRHLYKEKNSKLYIFYIVFFTVILDLVFAISMYNIIAKYSLSVCTFIALFIPISEIIIQIIQYILSKVVKPKLIPKLDLSNGVPENLSTMIIIPTIIKDKEKIKELISKMEVYYLANKSKNLYFTLLGDCTSSKKEIEEFDSELISIGKQEIFKLNEKYKVVGPPKFYFIYRKRKWNAKEKAYIGWERKRGFINQFNEFLLGNRQEDFIFNSIENYLNENKQNTFPKIKYVITLDADTNLVLNTGLELIGAMAHILNKPVLNDEKSAVIDGHGIMQPRIGIDLDIARISPFTKIFAGLGGTDSYTNAISDTYQDNFEEGIFTGKGIYDLEIFEKVLNDQIPENTVLSHDLLEGSYLRCGLVSDIMLMDGFPYKYNSFITRLHRWIRGDWQILTWLKKKVKNKKGETVKNPLRNNIKI